MTTELQSGQSKPSWTPHDYQKRAIRLLLSQSSGGLFLDPGLGKTSTCLAALKILKKQGLGHKALIIAPLRPMYKVWPDEIEKWEDFSELTYAIVHGSVKEHNIRSEADIYIINPEGLLWLLDDKRTLPQFDVLIIDESTKFKDSTTKRYRLLKKILPSIPRKWILTGTPVPNGISDLFGQIYILDGGRALGRYITHFRMEYFVRSGYNLYEWKPRQGAFEEIVQKISPLILQLSAEDYIKMPELMFMPPVLVELPPEARRRYDNVENDFLSLADEGNIVAANAAVAGMKCRQIANGAVYDDMKEVIPMHEAKLDALEDLLEELNGAPTLVMYEFQHDADRILGRLGDVPIIRSGMSPKKFETLIDNFNAGVLPVLLGHPASMAHGLNLQKSCHHIIWFGITWNLEHYDQAIARIYRQGQKSGTVRVYHIVAKDTLDEKVVKVLEQKDRQQQGLLQALGVSGARHTLGEDILIPLDQSNPSD